MSYDIFNPPCVPLLWANSPVAIIQINRIRLKKLPLYSLFHFENNFIMKCFYFIILFWNLLNIIAFIKISIIEIFIRIYLKTIYGLIGWSKYSLLTPIIIYLIINILDFLWSGFLNNIEDYKTIESKFAESYRICWTDRLMILVFILFPMLDLYGRNHSSIRRFLPYLATFMDPYFRYCRPLSTYCPHAGFFIIPLIQRRLRRGRGPDTVQLTQSTKLHYTIMVASLPERTISISQLRKRFYKVRPKYFVRWNSAYILALWAANRLYRVVRKTVVTGKSSFIKNKKIKGIVKKIISPSFYCCIFSLLFYIIISSLQGKCATFPRSNFIGYKRAGKYRLLFKKKEYRQNKFAFLNHLIIYIIFFVCRLQGLFISLFNPFFLLNLNYLSVSANKLLL
jgi:hypothetical protein